MQHGNLKPTNVVDITKMINIDTDEPNLSVHRINDSSYNMKITLTIYTMDCLEIIRVTVSYYEDDHQKL